MKGFNWMSILCYIRENVPFLLGITIKLLTKRPKKDHSGILHEFLDCRLYMLQTFPRTLDFPNVRTWEFLYLSNSLFCLFVSVSITAFTIVLEYSESMPELVIFWYWKELILKLSTEFHLNIHPRLIALWLFFVCFFFSFLKRQKKTTAFLSDAVLQTIPRMHINDSKGSAALFIFLHSAHSQHL